MFYQILLSSVVTLLPGVWRFSFYAQIKTSVRIHVNSADQKLENMLEEWRSKKNLKHYALLHACIYCGKA